MGLAALLTAPYWVVQGFVKGKYLSNLGQRLGFSIPGLEKLPAQRPGAMWIHVVSVGEAIAGIPLAKQLKEKHPQRALIISATTLTGYALAKERMPFADAVIYFPFDWAFSVRKVLEAVKPAVVLVLETEIWPNFLRQAKKYGVPVIFLSGRISARSFARYQKSFGLFGFYLKPFLASALGNAAAFLMQTETDAQRILDLGAPADRVRVSGNLKYDQELPEPTPLSNWLAEECKRAGRWPLIVAGGGGGKGEALGALWFRVRQGGFSIGVS